MSGERVVVAALGDSITAGTPGWDPDPEVRAQLPEPNPESQWCYWAEKADPRLEIRNFGVNRERTDQIAARLAAAVEDADVLVLQGGINDIVQGRPVEEAAANLLGMVVAGKERGLRVVVADVLPWNNGWPQAESTIRTLNGRIHAIAAEEGVSVLPFHSTLEDEANPGRMRPDWTSDGNHPSVEGHRRLGELAFRLG